MSITVANAPSVLSERQHHIADRNMPFIYKLLTERLYKNKIRAIVREYSTNAMDAHIEAGKPDLPIRITLPTSEDPILRIKDWGLGMNEEEIQEVYVSLGESTKRDKKIADEDGSSSLNGVLGLGSKSGFAYSKTFTVTAVKNGVKCVAVNVIGNSASIITMAKEETEEENGVEISIPISQKDIFEVTEEVNFVSFFFDVKPEIINGELERPVGFGEQPYLQNEHGALYRHISYGPEHYAHMGNVAYEIERNRITHGLPSYTRLVLNFGHGELEFTPSREHLDYTTQTITNFRDKSAAFFKAAFHQVTDPINNAGSLSDALTIYQKSKTTFGSYINEVLREASYKDEKLSYICVDTFFKREINRLLPDAEFRVESKFSKTSKGCSKICKASGIKFEKEVNLCFMDSSKPAYVSKIRHLASFNPNSLKYQNFVVILADTDTLKSIMDLHEISQFTWRDLSLVEVPKKVRLYKASDGSLVHGYRQCASGLVKIFNMSNDPYDNKIASDYWDGEITKFDDDTLYIYENISRTNCVGQSNESFYYQVEYVERNKEYWSDEFQGFENIKYVGVTKTGLKQFKKNSNNIHIAEIHKSTKENCKELAEEIAKKAKSYNFWAKASYDLRVIWNSNIYEFSDVPEVSDIIKTAKKIFKKEEDNKLSKEEVRLLNMFGLERYPKNVGVSRLRKRYLSCLESVKNKSGSLYFYLAGIIDFNRDNGGISMTSFIQNMREEYEKNA